MSRFERILFVRTDRMGDVLMNLPAIRTLRQAYPKAWITLLLDRSLEGLLNAHPDLDELMFVDAGVLRKSAADRKVLRKKIREARFDLAVISNPERWTHWMVFFCGIRERIGYRKKWGFLLTRSIADQKAVSGKHESDSNLDLIRLLTKKKWDGIWALSPQEEAVKRVNALLENLNPDKMIVAIHPGTSDRSKRWPQERFSAVALACERKGRLPVLIGGAEETAAAEAVKNLSGNSTQDLTGRLSLSDLVAFLSHPRVKLLISCDSGPVHIAWIQRTPVVAIFSKDALGSNPARWGPQDSKSETLHASPGSVSADQVIDLAEKILQKK